LKDRVRPHPRLAPVWQAALHRLLGLALLLIVTTSSQIAAQNERTIELDECSLALERGIATHASGAAQQAIDLFTRLRQRCPHLAQIEHNLGVFAAKQQDWDTAVAHFEAALAKDARASSTAAQLASIHRYRAQVAYANALNTTGPSVIPTFSVQGSEFNDQITQVPQPPVIADEAMQQVEDELYEWWQSVKRERNESWRSHYAKDYEPLSELRAIRQAWDQIGRQIVFTSTDAVVILSIQQGDAVERYLLLMRREQQRWIIYQETAL